MTATFPILGEDHRKLLSRVPWALVAPHERQALHNHDQTLKQLAERGGLSLCELAAVLDDRDWRRMTTGEAFARVREHLDRFEAQTRSDR